MIDIKPKPKRDDSVLYVRSVSAKNIAWLREDSKRKNMTTGEYLDEVINQLREGSSKKASRTRSRKGTKLR